MIRAAAIVLVASTAVAQASVYTNLDEVRACYPLGGGDFLVGTGGGLARVDARGTTLAVWTAVDGLPATRIDSISEVNGHLWIGTERGAALVELDGNRAPNARASSGSTTGGTMTGVMSDGATSASTARGVSIMRSVGTTSVRDAIAFDGAMYLATGGGVQRVSTSGATTIAFRGKNLSPARTRVAALAIADGELWAGTAGGLYVLRDGAFELAPIEAGANDVTSLYGDGATLWIATTAGLYAREGATMRSFGGGDLRDISRIDGAIVAGGYGDALVRVDVARGAAGRTDAPIEVARGAAGPGAARIDVMRGRLVRAELARGLMMTQAIAERDGAACAGGLDALYLRSGRDAAWIAAPRGAGLPANDVSAVATDGERVWVGTFDHGVAVLDRGAWRSISSPRLDPRVNALLVERRAGKQPRVWVATATGLSIIDGDNVAELTKSDGLPARGVLSLAQLRDGRILAGTMHGAVIVGDGRPVVLGAKQQLDVKNVWAVAEDADGYLWLGATTGVYRGREDGTWTRYAVATGHLRDDWVMALAVRGTSVWVGTYKGGVTRFDLGASITATPLGDGWINPGGLSWIGDRLYASTMEGLRVGDGASATWSSLGPLPARDTTGVAQLRGRLYISTRRGLATR